MKTGSEFRSQEFRRSVQATGAQQRFIRAGRPQTKGCVERIQRTILEEYWRPSFARYRLWGQRLPTITVNMTPKNRSNQSFRPMRPAAVLAASNFASNSTTCALDSA